MNYGSVSVKLIMATFLLFVFFCIPMHSQQELPLFSHFPLLKKTVPHIPFGTVPTPIIKLDRLGAMYHIPHLYLKNDGLSGAVVNGMMLPGGNKVRKLEFLLADALEKKAQTIVTIGDAGSNHALATAVYAKQLHMPCLMLLTPQIPTLYARRNLLLDLYFGARIHYFPDETTRDFAIEAISDIPGVYYIPSGGSNAIGALGFVNAAFELKQQIDTGLMPEPDYIYVTLGSMGTVAGLILGLKAAGLKSVVIPVRVVPQVHEGNRAKRTCKIFRDTNALLREKDPSFPVCSLDEDELDMCIRHAFFGESYAQITPEDACAIKTLLDVQGIKLEGTYTGKTFAALLYDAQHKNLSNNVVLFWDTFCAGDFAELTQSVDYKDLPKPLSCYFEDDVQGLDQGC